VCIAVLLFEALTWIRLMWFLMKFGLGFWLKRRKERQIAYVRRAIGDAAKEEEEYLPSGILLARSTQSPVASTTISKRPKRSGHKYFR
jgi:hypothetical protein